MNELNLLKVPKFLDNAIEPAAKEIGATIGNIFHAVFSPINYNVEKMKIRQVHNLSQYKNEIENEIDKIPKEKLIEPNLSIIGPALEASKFYIDDCEIRKLFAKLIASSINSDTNKLTHPSFVEIIKQLSPLDAKVLNELKLYESFNKLLPIIDIRFEDNATKNGFDVFKNVMLLNVPFDCYEDVISSLQNIERLGLISINYTLHISDDSLYHELENSPLVLAMKDYCHVMFDNDPNLPNRSPVFRKGILQSTNFGYNFAKVCFDY